MDAAVFVGPLCWRFAKPKERWRALGSPGSKTVFQWLGDRGVPASRRGHTMVLADEQGVVWIPGHTVADRVRLQSSDKGAFVRLRLMALHDLPFEGASESVAAGAQA